MKSKVLRLFILILISLFLSSCLSLTTALTQQASGAGSLSLDYRLNKKAIGIQKDSINNSNLIPLPLSINDFNEIAALIPGISILSFSESEDSEYVYIQTEIAYQSLNDLSSFLGFPIEYTSGGDINILILKIYEAQAPVSADTLSILETLFADDTLSFEFTFPGNIRNSSYGTVNGRTVNYEISLPELYGQSGFEWTLEW